MVRMTSTCDAMMPLVPELSKHTVAAHLLAGWHCGQGDQKRSRLIMMVMRAVMMIITTWDMMMMMMIDYGAN